MPVLADARCSKFYDYLNRDYPGFISLSCNYSSLDQSGLITWEGTAEIAWVPSNPSDIDNRRNRTTWCFGRVVNLKVVNDSGSFERPKCIPKMYIYKALYNPKTERLRLELRDILGLLRDKTIDDFKKDFEEENDMEEPLEEIEDLACGFPDDEDFEEDKFNQQQEEKKDKYWWEQWQREGTEKNIRIITEIMRRLKIPLQGSVSGEIRLPFTPSGSLVGVCGDLAFKSLTPSYIWSNYNGTAIISRINVNPPREKFYVSGVEDVDYNSVENGLNPISELIVLGRVKTLDENTPQEEIDENGNPKHCEVITENGPETTILPDGSPTNYIDLSTTTICEAVEQFKKTITTTRKERYGLLFPDSQDPDSNPLNWVDLSYKKIEEQFYDACTGALVRKVITEWNVWGKVFNDFYNEHLEFYIDPAEFGLSDITTNLISPYADRAVCDTTLIIDKIEEIKYFYKKQKLYKIETTIKEHMSKVLYNYHDALPANSPPGEDKFNPYRITSSSLEFWYEWGNGHQNHILIERDCLNRQNDSAVQKREEYLWERAKADRINGVIDKLPTHEQTLYTRTSPTSAILETANLIMTLVTPAERLALIEKRTLNDSSREGLANPPATEYLPRGKANQPNTNATEKWIEKPVTYRRKWEDAQCSEWLPNREIVDIGEVVTEEIIDAIGRVIYYLRQGQSLIHELILPFTQDWISGSFKPTFRVDVRECEDTYCHLVHSISMEFTQKENILLLELLWLGNTAINSPITSNQFVSQYLISSIPSPSQGTLSLNGIPVVIDDVILLEEIQNLTFTPSPTFTGATFSYAASDGVTQSNNPLVVNITPSSGLNEFTVENTQTLISTIIVDSEISVAVGLPTDLETNAIAVTQNPDDEFQYSYQMKEPLRRLKADTTTRLGLELSNRIAIYR